MRAIKLDDLPRKQTYTLSKAHTSTLYVPEQIADLFGIEPQKVNEIISTRQLPVIRGGIMGVDIALYLASTGRISDMMELYGFQEKSRGEVMNFLRQRRDDLSCLFYYEKNMRLGDGVNESILDMTFTFRGNERLATVGRMAIKYVSIEPEHEARRSQISGELTQYPTVVQQDVHLSLDSLVEHRLLKARDVFSDQIHSIPQIFRYAQASVLTK